MKTRIDRFFYKQAKKHWRFMRNLIYNRILLYILLILVQILAFSTIFIWGLKSLSIYLGGSFVLTTAFFIFLVNCPGKLEFKVTWLLPVVIAPFFGIVLYVIFHTNTGGRALKKNLHKTKKDSNPVLLENTKKLRAFEENNPISDFSAYIRNVGSYPSYPESQIDYYPGGEFFVKDLIKELKKAKHFIFIEFFIISADESWLEIVSVLKEKAAQGVEIRVLYDAVGSVFSATKAHQEFLKDAGIKSKIFLPLAPVFATHQNNRDHRKIVVIDGKVAFTGGINISSEYFNRVHKRFKYWKDTAVRIQGEAVKTFTTMFLQGWNIFSKETEDYAKYIGMTKSSPIQKKENSKHNGVIIPYGDDAYNNEDIAENTYSYILSHAKKYVHITTPYVMIDTVLMNELLFAAHRGVEVSVIVPSKPDHFISFCIGKTFLKDLIDGGVKVFTYDEGFIHAKNFTGDDIMATVGSVNLDYRSFFHHFECGLFMYDCEIIKKIEGDFQETMQHSTEMTAETYKKLSPFIRFVGRIMRVFAPIM